MKNLQEFKQLIKTYESITIDTLNEKYDEIENGDEYAEIEPVEVISDITGYGCTATCTLCQAVKQHDSTPRRNKKLDNCKNCVYGEFHKHDTSGANHPCLINETYQAIDRADTLPELLDAIHNRAKYMKSILKSLNL